MPRPKSSVPSYCLHKPSGQAYAYVNRERIYLGPHASPESREAYSALLDRLQSGLKPEARATRSKGSPKRFTIAELLLRFKNEKLPGYSDAERGHLQRIIRITRELFAGEPVDKFGPIRLRTVRQAMIDKGWSRSHINKQIARLRMIFRWGVGWELVPETIANALKAVESLPAGASEAAESVERVAVPDERLKAVRNCLTGRFRDIFDLMLLTGSRPGEIIWLESGWFNRSEEIWSVNLKKHKTLHHGKKRTLFFNATAQLILRQYLSADPSARLFPGVRTDKLAAAVKSACEKAFDMPAELRYRRRHPLTPAQKAKAKAWHREHSFTPHWLRHTVATKIADEIGLEASQRLLGHSNVAMTEHYAKSAKKKAVEAVNILG